MIFYNFLKKLAKNHKNQALYFNLCLKTQYFIRFTMEKNVQKSGFIE